ncbi:MAG: metal ABC transporter ATP-binding protein [Candidatus Heimdallarchaeota archaeon]
MSYLPEVEFSEVCLRYRSSLEPVLEDISFQSSPGDLIGILGPNGAGKSTLLMGILGLLRPSKGSIRVFGKPLGNKQRQSIGYVPQRSCVNAEMPILARDVIMMGRWPRLGLIRRPTKEDKKLVEEKARAVGVRAIMSKPFGNLSVGQQQRVLIGRALAQRPQLLLLDEPFSGIDVKGQRQICDVLEDLRKQQGITIFVVEHGLNPHFHYDQVLLLNRRLIEAGPPTKVFNSKKFQRMGTPHEFLSLISEA